MHSEPAAELNLDVANVAWLIDPPGDRADSQRGQDREPKQQDGSDSLRKGRVMGNIRGSQLAVRSDRKSDSRGFFRWVRIDEVLDSLNYTLAPPRLRRVAGWWIISAGSADPIGRAAGD